MSHGPHEEIQGKEGALLYDGCAECESRAEAGLEGCLHLDLWSFAEAWNRMVDVEHEEEGAYRSEAEAKLCRSLYHVALLIERHGTRNPWQAFAMIYSAGVR